MRQASGDRRSERGTVMVVAALAATTLLLFAALAIDAGLVWSSRTQSQNVSDGAALTAAATMIDPTPTPAQVRTGYARSRAIEMAQSNATVANASVTLRPGDITFGFYDLPNRTFDTSVSQSNPDLITGARVNVVMDGGPNERSPAFLAVLAGRTGFNVTNTAIGYLGFDGDWDPAEFDLPIAIDSCDLVSDPDGCGTDFCDTVASPPNPCLLNDPQLGDGPVTCLEFSSTPEQNACWTEFDDQNKDVNNPGLQDVIDNGNPHATEAGDQIYANNGDKTSTQKYLKDKMYGEGDFGPQPGPPPEPARPAGSDRYPEIAGPAKIDSWVVKLPVIECQTETHCSNRQTYAITGGVCFEIREITGPPARKIKGRFLCPSDPDPQVQTLYDDHCGDAPGDRDAPGGCNFGDRAERVVLVE